MVVRQLLIHGKLTMPQIARACGAGEDKQSQSTSTGES